MSIVMHKLFFLIKMTVLLGARERIAVNSNQVSSTRVDKQSICLRQTYISLYPGKGAWEDFNNTP